MGTYRFIHKYDGSAYSKWEWNDKIGKQINTVLVDDKNTVWIGFDGVSRFDGTAWQNFDKKSGLSSNTVFQLFQDRKNNIWALLPDGVAKYDGSTWTSFTKKTSGIPFRNMKSVAETKDGKIFFTNGYALVEYDGSTMKAVDAFKEVGTVQNMIAEDDGSLLMATEENGIARFKDGTVSFYKQENAALPSNAINYLFKDTDGKIWAVCGKTAYTPPSMPGTTEVVESPKDAFMRKLKEFDAFSALIQMEKL